MRKATPRRAIWAALGVSILVVGVARPAAAGAPSRQFYAPVQEKTRPARVTRKAPRQGALGKVGDAPVLRNVLHPLKTIRKVAGAAKHGVFLAIDHVQIARVEHHIKKNGTGTAPNRHEVRRSYLLQKKWRRGAGRTRQRFEPPDRILVASDDDIETPLSELDLRRSAEELRASVSHRGTLLPVGTTTRHVNRLVSAALAAVEGRTIYGAPDGVASLLENHSVAFDVVENTFDAARNRDRRGTGWLTDNQNAVLDDILADGDEDGAKSFLHDAYEGAVEVAVSAGKTYRTHEFQMDGELPLEVQAAIGQRPGLAAELRALEAQGVKLRVRTMEHTPPGVRRAALEYGAIGEETEFSPFVDHVQNGLRPDPRPTAMGVVRAISSGRFSRRRPPTARDLEQRIALVDQAVKQVMVIEATGPRAQHHRVAGALARVNHQLEPVRRVIAMHRIVFDVKHEAGEGARKLLPGVGALAATATGLQAAGVGEGAILMAEAGEDILQGAVEGASQDGQLRTRGEVWRRGTKIAAAGALVGSAMLAKPIHHLAESGLGFIAGPLMGVGSMALSGVVFGNAVDLNHKGRLARLRAGKVANTVPSLMFDKAFQRDLKRVGRRSAKARRQTILSRARGTLDGLVESGRMTGAERKRTVAALEATRDVAQLEAMVKMPTRRAIWRGALGEALGTPTRKALGQGMLITIVASSAVGALGLLSGPAWGMAVATLASAGEGLWGLYRSYRFERENRASREKALRVMARSPL